MMSEFSNAPRPYREGDRAAWVEMRSALWSHADKAQLDREIDNFLQDGHRNGVFFVDDEDGKIGAFAEVSLRSYGEGCVGTPVGHLEGVFVRPDLRGRHIAQKLVSACEAWVRDRGVYEFCSDSEISNVVSQKAHHAMGFVETGRVVTFRKELPRH